MIVARRTDGNVDMETKETSEGMMKLTPLTLLGPYCEPEKMDSEDPLFILYTSGSTGKTQRRSSYNSRIYAFHKPDFQVDI